MNFNWAERKRHQADARMQLSPLELLSLAVSLKAADDRYGGRSEGPEVIDQFRFGRTHVQWAIGAVEVTANPLEPLSLRASYAREYRQEQLASGAKDEVAKDPLGLGDQFASPNHWNSELYERVNSVGAGATVGLVPEKLTLEVGYLLSASEMEIQTFNRQGIAETTLLNAVAREWPRIHSRLHELNVGLGYQLGPEVRAGFQYFYSRYRLDDFAWNDLQPLMAGLSAENTTRFLFAGATYRGYDAHLSSLYLEGRF